MALPVEASGQHDSQNSKDGTQPKRKRDPSLREPARPKAPREKKSVRDARDDRLGMRLNHPEWRRRTYAIRPTGRARSDAVPEPQPRGTVASHPMILLGSSSYRSMSLLCLNSERHEPKRTNKFRKVQYFQRLSGLLLLGVSAGIALITRPSARAE
jgi:hypothetical protein